MQKLWHICLIAFLSVFLSAHPLHAAPMQTLDQLAPFFSGFEGTFVLYDEAADQYSVYNEPQSEKPLSPCSTFKIYNSLIALETGAAPDEKLVLRWNGKKNPIADWNKNHSMDSAIKNSVVWYYQELAARIGPNRMQRHLEAIPYGNRDISGGITRFWLQSSLKITAKEQVELLRRLYWDDLPFSQRNMEIVRRIILLSRQEGVVLAGKTGSAYVSGQFTLGWFVGMLEKENRRYYFATNIEAEKDALGSKAKSISVDILKSLSLL